MAWTTPTNVATGDVLTASRYNNEVVGNAYAGGPIYTTTALRDAAITSPFEGQCAYITAPTVPAATGTTTAVPTGIQTIYNGAAWVCVTPVSTRSETPATTTSTSDVTTLTGDATAQSVTVSTGTTALIQMSATNSINAVATVLTSVSVSGASTIAATVPLYNGVLSANITQGKTFVLAGLTAGANTFTLNYKVATSGTGQWIQRSITVQGVA